MIVFGTHSFFPILRPRDQSPIETGGDLVQVARDADGPPHGHGLEVESQAQGQGGIVESPLAGPPAVGVQGPLPARKWYVDHRSVRGPLGDVKGRIAPAAVFPVHRGPEAGSPDIIEQAEFLTNL